MGALHITKDNFEAEVLKSDKPVLIDFWATWCGPCQMMGPVIEEIANERTDIKVCKIDVDQQQELAAEYGVMSIPTLLVIKDGKEVNKAIGAMPKQSVLNLL
jgi:thioredoxin 1